MAVFEDIVADGSAAGALASAADSVARAADAIKRRHPNEARRLAQRALQIAEHSKREISPHADGGIEALFEADRITFEANETLADADELEGEFQEQFEYDDADITSVHVE